MELHDYIKIVGRRKWIIIQAVVIVAATAIVGSILQTPVYEATATLLVREKSLSSTLFGQLLPELSGQAERGLQTQLALVKLEPVAQDTIKDLGLSTSAENLLTKVSVQAQGQSNLLTISVKDSDRAQAQRLANALAQSYIDWNRDIANQDVILARDEIEKKMKETEKNLVDIAKRVDAAGGPTKLPEELRAQWGMATQLYSMLAEKYEQLRILSATSVGGSILAAPARLPRSPVSPKPVRNAFLGLIVGLVLGFGGALLIEYLDNTLKTKEQVEELLGVPVVGVIPRLKTAAKTATERLVVGERATVVGDWYKVLRTNLHYMNVGEEKCAYAVTSPGPGEGKTSVVVNLAVAFSSAGKKTRILCTDLRRPAIHEVFGLSKNRGLTNVIVDGVPLEEVTRTDPATGVEIIPSGPLPPDPPELLASARMKEAVEKSCEQVDILLVDCAPLAGMSDSLEVATKVDGVILVVAAGKTTREGARRAVAALRGVESHIVGVVLLGAELGREEAYGYYGYGEQHAAGRGGRKRRTRPGRPERVRERGGVAAAEEAGPGPGEQAGSDAEPDMSEEASTFVRAASEGDTEESLTA